MAKALRDKVRIGLTAFLGTVSVLAGIGFLVKLYEFWVSLEDKDIVGFAIAPLANYFLVAGGFLALLIWAFLSGQFSDTEKAKTDLLEEQERMDAEDPQLHPEVRDEASSEVHPGAQPA